MQKEKEKKKQKTKTVDSKLLKTKNGRTMLLSKCAACSSKKSRFMKEQKPKGILRSLGLKTPSRKILLFGDLLL